MVPGYVKDNLRHDMYEWQEKALQSLLCYDNYWPDKPSGPTHLMFNMATGSGKTLLMAACMLYYYQQHGYRKFIFLVNQNNILDKTEHNFINRSHSKYLFNSPVCINNRIVPVRAVSNFTAITNGIEIMFTTIQKLYSNIHSEREGCETLRELHKWKIAMIADEAHHLNAQTKQRGQAEIFTDQLGLKSSSQDRTGAQSWEDTVKNLLLKGRLGDEEGEQNLLLEFTATVPKSRAVKEKYESRILYKFELEDFLKAGNTKDVNLLVSTASQRSRILMALIFNWYRCSVAAKHGIYAKPVILFKSGSIAESQKSYEDFIQMVEGLKGSDIEKVLQNRAIIGSDAQPILDYQVPRINQIKEFIKKNNIKARDILIFIQTQFKANNIIITNSATNKSKTKEKTTEEQEAQLNSLEDRSNPIRAVFTVNRLVEGWDVLNLFDIVRIDEKSGDGIEAKARGIDKSTTSDKQLIGRGVRYYPFRHESGETNKRKFDANLEHELRILEEFYYHSSNDRNYISELKAKLAESGYIASNKVFQKFKIKESFRRTKAYSNALLWLNDKQPNPSKKRKSFDKYRREKYERTILVKEEFSQDHYGRERQQTAPAVLPCLHVPFKDIDYHIFRKAAHCLSIGVDSPYSYSRLAEDIQIKSIDDLRDDKYLGRFTLDIRTDAKSVGMIPRHDLMLALAGLIKFIVDKARSDRADYIGTAFKAKAMRDVSLEKLKKIDKKDIKQEVADYDFYILDQFAGTSEEHSCVEFIANAMEKLKEIYKDVYLLRNEECIKIYNFSDGRGFQPDFILLLASHEDENLFYQVYIEPKGKQFAVNDSFRDGPDGWKERFLEEISQHYNGVEPLRIENYKYRLIGLPFYNDRIRERFEQAWNDLIMQKGKK